MTSRLNPYAANPQLMQPMIEFGTTVAKMGLEPSLVELIKIRASQVNGCAVCLAMHTAEARKAGETDERMIMLDAWRESDLFSAREKAAMAWTEALTRLADTHAPDADYELVAAQFTPEEQVKLTMMIGVINSFNKFGVGFRLNPAEILRRKAA
jgi:AhpD family alkylhydroperoxidase